MRQLTEWLSDLLSAVGASICFFSIVLIILFLVSAIPFHNPYGGILVFLFLPLLAIVGGMVIALGMALGKRGADKVHSSNLPGE